jgi:hypothetical protein
VLEETTPDTSAEPGDGLLEE